MEVDQDFEDPRAAQFALAGKRIVSVLYENFGRKLIIGFQPPPLIEADPKTMQALNDNNALPVQMVRFS